MELRLVRISCDYAVVQFFHCAVHWLTKGILRFLFEGPGACATVEGLLNGLIISYPEIRHYVSLIISGEKVSFGQLRHFFTVAG